MFVHFNILTKRLRSRFSINIFLPKKFNYLHFDMDNFLRSVRGVNFHLQMRIKLPIKRKSIKLGKTRSNPQIDRKRGFSTELELQQ